MRSDVRLLLCLAALALVPYLNALPTGFTFDDQGVILENPLMAVPQAPVREFFTSTYEPGSLYRPLTFLSFWLNRHTAGGGPLPFHLVNVVLHVMVTLLVFILAADLGLGRRAAFLATALFAVHPIHTEAVTSIVGRAELLAAAAVIGALLCARRAAHSRRRSAWLGLAAAAFGLGLLCKESAFVALPLLFVVALAESHGSLRTSLVSTLRQPTFAVFLIVGVAYLLLRHLLLGTLTLREVPGLLDNPLAHSTLAVRLSSAVVVLGDYLRLLLLPVGLSADYSINQIPPVTNLADHRFVAAIVLLGCATTATWLARRKLPAVALGLLFALAALSLTANILFPIGTIKAERLLYLPSVGFAVAAGSAGAWLMAERRRLGTAACALAALALALQTWERNRDWESNLTLFEATVQTSPQSAKAYSNLGVALEAIGKYEEAGFAFRKSLSLHPEYEHAAYGLGVVYQRRGMKALALKWYDEALRINPKFTNARLNRGVLLLNDHQYAAAEESFRTGLEITPDHPRLLTGLGLTRLALGDTGASLEALERAAQLDTASDETRRALEMARSAHAGNRETDAADYGMDSPTSEGWHREEHSSELSCLSAREGEAPAELRIDLVSSSARPEPRPSVAPATDRFEDARGEPRYRTAHGAGHTNGATKSTES